MKTILSTLLITAFITTNGQVFNNMQFGLEAGGNYIEVGLAERIELQMSLTGQIKNSQLFLGPIVQMYATEAQTDASKPKFTGLRGGYMYRLPAQATRFDLLFRYEFTLQQYENRWVGNFYNETTQTYVPLLQESEEIFSAHTIGYGFSYDISKHLRVQTVIALGIYFSNIKEESKHSFEAANIIYDFRGYGDFGFCWKPSLSLGYTF